MIIDCHVHVNWYEHEDRPALPHRLAELRREMQLNRVSHAVILTSFKDLPGRPSTREVADAVRGQKEFSVVAGIAAATFTPEVLESLRPLVAERIVRGLKLYPGYEPYYPHDPKLTPAFRFAAEHRMPVMIHTGDTFSAKGKLKYAHPLEVDEVAVDHPDVPIIICHLGNPWFQDTMEVVYKNENVYTDISGLVLGDFSDRFERYMRDQLQEMIIYGMEPSKVLFGTDWPISSMRSYLEFIEELNIPPADLEKIMYQNAARLFDIPISGSGASASGLLGWLGRKMGPA
jgi:hypothetical protein